jgi:hypothetical protein
VVEGRFKGNFFNENQIDGAGSNLPDHPPASGLQDAADDDAIGEHVVIVVVPLAEWSARRCALED